MEEINLKIGEAAGVLYHKLENGECSLNKIKVHLGSNGFDFQVALMAVGWLAREDKICINKATKKWSVRLKE